LASSESPFNTQRIEENAEKGNVRMRKTGITIIGDIPWGTHICQFYRTKDDLIDILVPYFRAGLENNELCIWVTSEPLGVKEAKESLGKAVRHLDDYISKGGQKIKKGYYCTHWSEASASSISRAFVKKHHTLEKMPAAFALSHDAVFLLADAMKRADSLDKDEIRDALKTTKTFNGVTGKIIFDENRNPVKNAVIYEINNGKIRYFESIAPSPLPHMDQSQ